VVKYVHLHGDVPMFDLVADYPGLQAINWHDRENGAGFGGRVRASSGDRVRRVGPDGPVHNGRAVAKVRNQARDAIERQTAERFYFSRRAASP